MTSLEDMRAPGERPNVIAMILYLMFGPILWGVHLMLTYGAHTLVCALSGNAFVSRATVLGATALIAMPLGFVLLQQRRIGRLFGMGDGRAGQRSYDSIARLAGLLSLTAILWAGAASAIVSACASGR